MTACVKRYQPELGQAAFGQPSQEIEPGWLEESVISTLSAAWESCVHGQHNPFGNSGHRYDGKSFRAHAYSWNDEDTQGWNLAWRDWRVSWYKHANRGVSVSRELTEDEARECVAECVAEIARIDSRSRHE